MVRTVMLLAGIALAMNATPAAAIDSPTAVVSAFYRWYFAANRARPGGWEDPRALRAAAPYLSPALYADLTNVLALQRRTREAILDWDPFDDAQIEASSATPGAPAATSGPRSAVVPVTIHYPHVTAGHVIHMFLIRDRGAWRINDVASAQGNRLRTILEADLKRR